MKELIPENDLPINQTEQVTSLTAFFTSHVERGKLPGDTIKRMNAIAKAMTATRIPYKELIANE